MYEQIARNKRRTIAILAAFVGLIALVALALTVLLSGGWVGVVIAVLVAGGSRSSRTSSQTRSRWRRAEPSRPTRPTTAGTTTWWRGSASRRVSPSRASTSSTTLRRTRSPRGETPSTRRIAVTTGLLEKMNRVELEGVLAHELSHVKNYDILVTTVAVVAVGAIALIGDIGLRFAFWGGMRDRRDSNDNSPLGGIIAILALALIVLAPFAGYLMQFAMSRNREYLADASGVQLTRYPPGLISALEKLRDDKAVVHNATKATAQMWIEQPLETEREEPARRRFDNLFDTHPPLEDRIARLQEM